MTDDVRRFFETNAELLDTNMPEFFHIMDNGLSFYEQSEVIECLDESGIDYTDARDSVLNYIVTMYMLDVVRPVFLKTFIQRYLEGRLGCDYLYLADFILENSEEYDVDIVREDNDYKIYPRT